MRRMHYSRWSSQLTSRACMSLAGLAVVALPFALFAGCAGDPESAAPESVGEASEHLVTCVTLKRGQSAVADARISKSQLTGTFGTQTLMVDYYTESLIKFDLPVIPGNAVLNSATLTLYTTVAGGGPINLHAALAPWNESNVTFTSFNQQFAPAIAAVLQPTTSKTSKSVDLTALAQAWIAGTKENHGVVLETASKATSFFMPSEGGVSAEQDNSLLRPALTLCYTTPDDHCLPQPCLNGATCQNSAAGFTCACAPGFTGTTCQTNIDDCANSPCQNGGTCNDDVGSFTCACAPGFTGVTCQTDVDECAPSPCLNGGVCTDGVNSHSCACPPGFAGLECETDINDCASSPCVNGACTDGVNSYTCACDPGWTGQDCSVDVDECATMSCGNGLCVDGVNSATCSCLPGWAGAQCDVNIDECASQPCLNGGTCADGVDGYTCVCQPGYAGANCETDINDCLPNPCQNAGTCTDGVNSYSCQCPPGYTGATCGVAAAATIAFAGSDYTTHAQWRNASVLKLLDLDGNNIYGTDGWRMFGGNTVKPYQAPSYATVAQAPGTVIYSSKPVCRVPGSADSSNELFVCMNDPGLSNGASCQTGTVYTSANGESDFITITVTVAKSFRIGEIQDIHDWRAISPIGVRLRQTVGGSANSGLISAASDRNLNGDMYLFDVTNAKVGDVFVLSGLRSGGHPSNGVWGVFFDGGH
jgi:EGF domain-containing protein/growth factor-like EGF protein